MKVEEFHDLAYRFTQTFVQPNAENQHSQAQRGDRQRVGYRNFNFFFALRALGTRVVGTPMPASNHRLC